MGFHHHAKIWKKNDDPIPRKCSGRWKDGKSLFCRTVPATADGRINIANEILAALQQNPYITNEKQCCPTFYI